MIELDTPEGRQQLREYYAAIGMQVTVAEVYFVTPGLEPEQHAEGHHADVVLADR